MIKPNPIPHDTVINPERVGDLRRVNCRYYDQCLDWAIAERWHWFVCIFCDVHADKSLAELRAEADAIAASLVRAQED